MEKSNPTKIVIITSNPFPFGFAGTNRILTYCKGFIYNGYQPEVLCIRPTENYGYVLNNQKQGIFEGIYFSYPGKTTIRVKSFLGRRFNDFVAFFLSLLYYISLLQKRKISFIIFYGNNLFAEITFILCSRLFGKNIYKEENENPIVFFKKDTSIFKRIIKWYVINKLYKLYDGVFVMTNPLKFFFIGKHISENKILVVSQTVDLERFEPKINSYKTSMPTNYIAYVGSLDQEKDGILTLIESFRVVSSMDPLIHLIIAGEGEQLEKEALLSLINNLKLNETVHYIGRISSTDIPAFLINAKLLVSCRPKSLQSDYGFPTKIIEYLATGRPTVTTATGELTLYLEDRVNSFVAKMASPEIFALKIMEVLQNYDFAIEVAKNGKSMVRDKFNPVIQTKKIIDFCSN
jgi:glycosyltransferase involved in cell wall biosynthesis